MKDFAEKSINLQEPDESPYPVYDPPIPDEPIPDPVPNPEPVPPSPPNPNPSPFPMPPEPIPSFPPDVEF